MGSNDTDTDIKTMRKKLIWSNLHPGPFVKKPRHPPFLSNQNPEYIKKLEISYSTTESMKVASNDALKPNSMRKYFHWNDR